MNTSWNISVLGFDIWFKSYFIAKGIKRNPEEITLPNEKNNKNKALDLKRSAGTGEC